MAALEGEIIPPEKQEEDRKTVERGFWPLVRKVARRVPFVEDAIAGWHAAMDPATPKSVKVVLLGALAYFVLPVDVIPDAFAAFGFIDDAGIIAAAIRAVGGHITEEHREKARAWLNKDAGRVADAQAQDDAAKDAA